MAMMTKFSPFFAYSKLRRRHISQTNFLYKGASQGLDEVSDEVYIS